MIVVGFIDWDGLPCPMTLATLRELLSQNFEARIHALDKRFQIGGESGPVPSHGRDRLLVTTLVVRAVIRPSQQDSLRGLLVELAAVLHGKLRVGFESGRTFRGADSSAPIVHRRGTSHPRAGPRWHRA